MTYPKYQILSEALQMVVKKDPTSTVAKAFEGQITAHMKKDFKNDLIYFLCARLDPAFKSIENKIAQGDLEIIKDVTDVQFDLFEYILNQDKEGELHFVLSVQNVEDVRVRLREIELLFKIVSAFKDDLAEVIASKISYGDQKKMTADNELISRISYKLDIEQAKLRRDMLIAPIYALRADELEMYFIDYTYSDTVKKIIQMNEKDQDFIEKKTVEIINLSREIDVYAQNYPSVNLEFILEKSDKEFTLKSVGSGWEVFGNDVLLKKNLTQAYTNLVHSLIETGVSFNTGVTYSSEDLHNAVRFINSKYSIIVGVVRGLFTERNRIKTAEDIFKDKFK